MITVDPGVAGSGWAVWNKKDLLDYGVINPKYKDWQKNAKHVCNELYLVIRKAKKKYKINPSMYVEEPANFTSARGQVSAASGSVIKLSILVGMLMAEFDVTLVPIRDWKGQLPKNVVEKRVKELLPDCKAKSHAVDAVGIGLYLLGRF